MCVWLLAGWGLAVVAGARLPARASSPRVGLTAALVAAALAGTAVAIGETPPRREAYKPMRAIAGRLEAALPPSQSARVEPVGALGAVGLTSELTAGTVFWLRRHGRSVVTTPDVADRIGSAYARGSYQRVVRIFVDKPPPSGKAVLAAFQILDEVDEKTVHHVAVTLSQPRR
jgi:hypothetical protein